MAEAKSSDDDIQKALVRLIETNPRLNNFEALERLSRFSFKRRCDALVFEAMKQSERGFVFYDKWWQAFFTFKERFRYKSEYGNMISDGLELVFDLLPIIPANFHSLSRRAKEDFYEDCYEFIDDTKVAYLGEEFPDPDYPWVAELDVWDAVRFAIECACPEPRSEKDEEEYCCT